MTNPFDFSDFGSAAMPMAGSATGPTVSGFDECGRGTLVRSGFDPFGAGSPGQPPSPTAFARPSSDGIHVARPPLALFVLALALACAGIALSAVRGHELTAAAAGWFLAGPVAIGVLSAYTRIDTRRRAEAVYSAPGWMSALYWVVVAVCLAGICLGAWHLAMWAGGQ